MIDGGGLEAIEKTPLPERPTKIGGILELAAHYLAKKRAGANQPDSEADWQMRIAGARLQQRLVSYFLENYDGDPKREKDSRLAIRNTFAQFWQGYRQLVIAPLLERGYNPDTIPKSAGREMVLTLEHGVKGMLAACVMAKACGWEIRFPTLEEDVKIGKDLIIKRGGREVPLQIKCFRDAKFSVARGGTPNGLTVCIPANPEFFRDPEVGIPHNKHADQFDSWVVNQLKGGK